MAIFFGKYLRVDSGSFVSFSYWALEPLLCIELFLHREFATKRTANRELAVWSDGCARTSDPADYPHMRGSVFHSPRALDAEHSIEVT